MKFLRPTALVLSLLLAFGPSVATAAETLPPVVNADLNSAQRALLAQADASDAAGASDASADATSTAAADELTPEDTALEVGEAVPDRTIEESLEAEASSNDDGSVDEPIVETASGDPDKDLWVRIRKGFALKDLDTPLVRRGEAWYSSRHDYLERMFARSSKYLFHIVEEIERRKMPMELALLPFIESAYNPEATSHARAAGMWQFIPSTGRLYRLRQNAFRDDRRDVMASTNAALDYLERLHSQFGDWHLALAAYNWGEGSVGRAIAKNKRAKRGTDYLSLYRHMPRETQFYVPKLQAVKNLVADPERYKIALPAIENHPYFDTVDIQRDIDVELAAQLAEVEIEDFNALNPSLNRPVILAAGMPRILLPWDNAEIFRRNLKTHIDSGEPLSSWTVWVAPSNMKTADLAKRIKMDERELREVNKIPQYMIIRAGSTLLVPRPADHEHDVTERIAHNGQLSMYPETELRRVVYKAGKRDTVKIIARRYGIDATKVASWNNLKVDSAFKPGQNIVLYRWVPVNSKYGTPVRKVSHAPAARTVQR